MKHRQWVIGLLLCLALTIAAAQEQTSPASKHESSAAQLEKGTKPEPQDTKREGEASVPGASVEGQLAEESREAAGEDEHTEFKQSAAVRMVGKITGLSLHSAYLVSIILNFAILATLIFLMSRLRLPAMFRSRTATIQKGVEEARRASEEANHRLAEIESRLSKLDTEISNIRTKAEADVAAEEERIREAAEEDKRKIVEAAEQEVIAAAKLAQRELKAYAANLAVSLAEKRIHVDAATDRALIRSFVEQLSDPGAPGKDGK